VPIHRQVYGCWNSPFGLVTRLHRQPCSGYRLVAVPDIAGDLLGAIRLALIDGNVLTAIIHGFTTGPGG